MFFLKTQLRGVKYDFGFISSISANPVENICRSLTGYSASLRMESVGRNFFSPGPGRVQELANGKSLWIGTFQSVRVGWTIRLNVDMANKPAYEEG